MNLPSFLLGIVATVCAFIIGALLFPIIALIVGVDWETGEYLGPLSRYWFEQRRRRKEGGT